MHYTMFAKRDWCEVIVWLLCLGHANGTVTVTPSNTVVVAGNPMSMECRTTNGSRVYRWTLTRPTSSRKEFIFMNYNGGPRLGLNYSRYGVDVDEHGSGRLYLNATQLNDTGLYTCYAFVDDDDQLQNSAQLIVFESEPFCETNYTSEDNSSLVEGDIIWMRCSVNFRGIWSPTVEWKQHTENDKQDVDDEQIVIQGVSTETVFNNRVTTTYVHVVDLSKTRPTYFSCRVFFQWHNGSVQVTATNVPDYTYTWNFPRLLPHRVELETTEELHVVPLQVEVEPIRTTTTMESGSNQWYMKMVYNASTSCTGPLRRFESSYSFVYDSIPTATQNVYEGIDGAEEDDDAAAQAMTSCNGYPPLVERYSGLMAATGNATRQYDSLDQYDNMDLCDEETEDPTARKMPGCPDQKIGEQRHATPVPKKRFAVQIHPSGSSDYLLMVGNAKESKIDDKPLYDVGLNSSDEDNYHDGNVKPLYNKDSDDYLQPGSKVADNC